MESKVKQLMPVVREMLSNNPDALNSEMAEVASKRIGLRVERKDISAVRTMMGLNMRQQIEGSLQVQLLERPVRQDKPVVLPPAKSTAQVLERWLQVLALELTAKCVRNTVIETYHAEGKLSDAEMKEFNIEVSNRLYTSLSVLFGEQLNDARPSFLFSLQEVYPDSWNMPKLIEEMLPQHVRIPADIGSVAGSEQSATGQ